MLFGVPELDVDTALASTEADRFEATGLLRPLGVLVDRERARFGAWYELFPRSWGGFAGVEKALPELARLGFDVVYLPPIHPIGTTNRKGRNNALTAGPGRSGEPLGDRERGGRSHCRRSRARNDRGLRPAGLGRPAPRRRGRARLRHPVLARPPVAEGAPGVVPPPSRRNAQVRREPAQALPGHLQPQLRQRRLEGTLARAPRCRAALGRPRRPGLPRRQPPHEAAPVLGVADPGGARRRSGRRVPRRGLHATGDDGGAREGGLQPVLHLLHLEEHEGGTDRVHDRVDPIRAAAVLPAERLRQHAGHPPRVPAAGRAAGVRGEARPGGDALAGVRDLLRLRALRVRRRSGTAARSTSTPRSTRSRPGHSTGRCCRWSPG